MKLQYWGTAAFEGIPSLFCSCPNCMRARSLGGRNLRARSQAVIDDRLLIDPNADTSLNSQRYGFFMPAIRTVLITHGHCDHLYNDDFGILGKHYSHGDVHLTVYGAEENLRTLRDMIAKKPASYGDRLTLCPVEAFRPFETADGYKITPYTAAHSANALLYGIEHDGKRLLYAHDTAMLPRETLDFLARDGKRFDYISIDCTFCNDPRRDPLSLTHQGLQENIETRGQLYEIGAADRNTVFCCNHFSHNGKDSCYDDFAPVAAAAGFLTSYDGMTVTV